MNVETRNRLDKRLRDAGIAIHGTSEGRIDYKDEASPADRMKGDAILAAFDVEAEAAAARAEIESRKAKQAKVFDQREKFVADLEAIRVEALTGTNEAKLRKCVADLAAALVAIVEAI